MFAYCRNNPVVRIDISGSADTAVEEEFDDDVEVTPTIPIDGGGGGGVNGGSGNGGIVGTAGNGGSGPSHGGSGIVFGGNPKSPPTYPKDPNDFHPRGLQKKVIIEPGTGKNGGIIKWFIPGTKQAVFEWDEDYKYGPHYHAMEVELGSKHLGDHNRAGSVIEEPWRSRYF